MARKYPKEAQPAIEAMVKDGLQVKEIQERLAEGKAGLRRPVVMKLRTVQDRVTKARKVVQPVQRRPDVPLQDVADSVTRHWCELVEAELDALERKRAKGNVSIAKELIAMRGAAETAAKLRDRGPDPEPNQSRGAKRGAAALERRARKPSTLLDQLTDEERRQSARIDRNGEEEPASADSPSTDNGHGEGDIGTEEQGTTTGEEQGI